MTITTLPTRGTITTTPKQTTTITTPKGYSITLPGREGLLVPTWGRLEEFNAYGTLEIDTENAMLRLVEAGPREGNGRRRRGVGSIPIPMGACTEDLIELLAANAACIDTLIHHDDAGVDAQATRDAYEALASARESVGCWEVWDCNDFFSFEPLNCLYDMLDELELVQAYAMVNGRFICGDIEEAIYLAIEHREDNEIDDDSDC